VPADAIPAAAEYRDQDADRGDGGEVADGMPAVTPQAPLDVRVLEAIGEFLQARPRWSERAPSMAEVWEYSTTGDWVEHEKSVKRVLHGLCVLIAFAVTYPVDWMVQVARQKPIGFLLVVAVLFVLSKVL
jgi:hypothetical protein